MKGIKFIKLKMSDYKFILEDSGLVVQLIHPVSKRVIKEYYFETEHYYNGFAKFWIKEFAPKSTCFSS